MNQTRSEMGISGTAASIKFLLAAAIVCFWQEAALAEAWGPAHRLVPTPVRFVEIAPSLESTDMPGTGAAEIIALIRKKEFDKALALATRIAQSNPNSPSGYNLQGLAYLGKQDWDNARKSFGKALEVNPQDPMALANLAQIDIHRKDTAAARKRFEALLAKDKKNVEAMLGLAQLEILKGDNQAAFSWFEKAKAARPDAVDPRVNIAAYHMRRGNFRQAIDELTDAMRRIPGNVEILSVLGQAQLADGQSRAAMDTFRKLVLARPDAPLAYYYLAAAQINMNDTTGAVQNLTKALQMQPDFLSAIVLLAGVEMRAKRYPEALKLARHAQSSQPDSAVGLTLEGDIHMVQQRYADAAKSYEKALAKSQAGPIFIKLHAAKARAGNAKAADADLQRWLKDYPDDLFTLQYAAEHNSSKGQKKLAIEQYQRLIQKDAKNQMALNNLAVLYHQEGDPRALSTAEAAHKLNPQSPISADTLGWILVEQGKTARGLELLKSALAKEPKNPEIRYHVAAARAKSGDKANARKELEALLASGQAFPQRDAAQALLKEL